MVVRGGMGKFPLIMLHFNRILQFDVFVSFAHALSYKFLLPKVIAQHCWLEQCALYDGICIVCTRGAELGMQSMHLHTFLGGFYLIKNWNFLYFWQK